MEFLFAASNRDLSVFDDLTAQLHTAIDTASRKVKAKPSANQADTLVDEADALLDLLYFTYGSLVLMGVDPYDLFNTVHKANMGKIFPDGKAHFDPVTHKILKPDNWETDFAPEGKMKQELDRQIRVAMSKLSKTKDTDEDV